MNGPGQSLQEFKAITIGFARPNRFGVFFNAPTDMIALNSIGAMSIKGAVIPQKTIQEIEVKHLGMNRKVHSSPSFEPVILTYRSDRAWVIRSAFEDWMDLVGKIDGDGKLTMGYHNAACVGSMFMIQLDTDKKPIAMYTCHDIYPTNIGEISLDQDSVDSIEEFSVTFSIGWWSRDKTISALNTGKQILSKFGFI